MKTEQRETGYYWVKYLSDLEWEVYFWNQDDKCWYSDILAGDEIILPLFQISEKRIWNPDEQKEHFEITGFNTPDEWAANESGYNRHERIIMRYIKEWDGYINSEFGRLMRDKMKELKDKI